MDERKQRVLRTRPMRQLFHGTRCFTARGLLLRYEQPTSDEQLIPERMELNVPRLKQKM